MIDLSKNDQLLVFGIVDLHFNFVSISALVQDHDGMSGLGSGAMEATRACSTPAAGGGEERADPLDSECPGTRKRLERRRAARRRRRCVWRRRARETAEVRGED